MKEYQPFSSGSDKPGILPAKRPCVTADPSPGDPNTIPETNDKLEANAHLLPNNPVALFPSPLSPPPFAATALHLFGWS